MINSKDKGKRGEREVRDLYKDAGFEARRGEQYCGNNGDPDVVTNIPWIHDEVKFVEKLNIYKAMQQAINDSQDKVPVLWHRKSRQEWHVTLRASDFLELLKKVEI